MRAVPDSGTKSNTHAEKSQKKRKSAQLAASVDHCDASSEITVKQRKECVCCYQCSFEQYSIPVFFA